MKLHEKRTLRQWLASLRQEKRCDYCTLEDRCEAAHTGVAAPCRYYQKKNKPRD